MDKKYVTLFQRLAQATAASAESVMDYDKQNKDEKGLQAAITLRDDFQELSDKIKTAGENYAPTKNDAARLLVGAMVMANQLQNKMTDLRNAMSGYQTDVIPKLQDIVNNTTSDEEAITKANQIFVIENEE